MASIRDYLTLDHRHCDSSLADLESVVSHHKWGEVHDLSEKFISEMERHFNIEEKILFPSFEEVTGMKSGPTMVMRMEHSQMRDMLEQLKEALGNKNYDRTLGTLETLMIYIQQHNGKEEQMLYAMCDMHLSFRAEELIEKMANTKI